MTSTPYWVYILKGRGECWQVFAFIIAFRHCSNKNKVNTSSILGLALHSLAQVGAGHPSTTELPSAGRSVGVTQVFSRCSEKMPQCPLLWEQMYTERLLHASKPK